MLKYAGVYKLYDCNCSIYIQAVLITNKSKQNEYIKIRYKLRSDKSFMPELIEILNIV